MSNKESNTTSFIERQGILLCLLGPAGSGKSTISSKLLEEFKGTLAHSISYTTRQPRQNETHGVHYYFVSKEEFLARQSKGEFFEYEQVHGNLYATPKTPIDNAINSGIDIVLDIDINGARSFKKSYNQNVVTIFFLPPASGILADRIKARGDGSTENISKRLNTARKEFELFLDTTDPSNRIDYCMVNADLDYTYESTKMILIAERHRLSRLDPNSVKEMCQL